jgi:tetratricopeptide (TPR) repeat protein
MGQEHSYTPDEYRKDIHTAELEVARLGRGFKADEVLSLLHRLDRLYEGHRELEASGLDMRSEKTRIETVHNILDEKAGAAVRILDAHRGFARARAEIDPTPERWWWYLDERVAERQARRLRRAVRMGAGAAVLLAVLVLVYVRFFRPDEATLRRYELSSQAESQSDMGDYAAALASYQDALAVAPDDPEVNLMIGVMYEALGRTAEAEAQYARAEPLYESRAMFLAVRSQSYCRLGWFEKGQADAEAAIALDGEFAAAYMALGTAYEGQGLIDQAIDALNKCAELADAQGQDQLYVIAKTRIGMLLQRPSGPQAGPGGGAAN